jgi:putative transposase
LRQVKPLEYLSIRKQCSLLQVPRSRLYYSPVPEKPENLKMMEIMDKHLINHPAEGVLSMVGLMAEHGFHVNPKRIRRLFKIMDYCAIYRRKNLSKLGQADYIRSYLLRNLVIDRPNQVWSTDITYIPMKKGFLYLTAIMDVYSRKILSWGISNTLEAQWCVDVFNEAVERYGAPEIINSDQGSQYTSAVWTRAVEKQNVKISMDGKGRAIDNIWIERFWKTIKYNHIYLNPCDTGLELFEGVQTYIEYYHNKKHQTIGMKPNEAYSISLNQNAA